MSTIKNPASTPPGPSAAELMDSYKRTLSLLQKRAAGLKKRSSPNADQAEADVVVFLRLLQIAHSLFQEVDELKQAITEIAEGMGVDNPYKN